MILNKRKLFVNSLFISIQILNIPIILFSVYVPIEDMHRPSPFLPNALRANFKRE